MAYVPTLWTEGVTDLGPSNLNKLENGVQAAAATADAAVVNPGQSANKALVSNGSNWLAQLLVNANIDPAAAIAYSKLTLAGSVVNNDIATGAAIAKSKLAALGIVDADVDAAAAIVRTKLARDYTEVTRSAVLSVANTTHTAVGFDTETIDDGNKHDNVTNNSRITFATAGLFTVGAYVNWAANGTGGRYAKIFLNGATVLTADDAAAGGAAFSTGDMPLMVPHVFAANDYVELFVYQSSGGALNLSAATKLWAVRV